MAFASFDIAMVFNAVNNAKGAFNSVNRDLDKTKTKATQTANRLRAIQLVLGGIAIGAAAQLGKSVVKLVSDFEQLNIRLRSVEGGSEKATKVLNEMVEAFGKTSIGVKTTIDGLIKLQAAGLSYEKAKRTVKATADAVAAFGGTTQEFNRAIIGMQQTIGKGTASMEELRQQIGEAIPAAMFVAAREMGIGVAQLVDQISKGEILGTTLVQKMTEGFEKTFGGFLEKASNSIAGAIGQIKTTIEVDFARLFTEGAGAGLIKDFLLDVNDALKDVISSISDANIEGLVNGFAGLLTVVQSLLPAVIDLAAAFGDVLNAVGEVVGVFGTLYNSMAEIDKTIVSDFAAAGLIGRFLFGLSGGPLLIFTSLAALFSELVNFKGKVDRLFGNFTKEALIQDVAQKSGGDVEKARALLQARIDRLRTTTGLGDVLAQTFFGQEMFEATQLATQAMDELQDAASDTRKQFEQFADSKGLELVASTLGKDFIDTGDKLSTMFRNLEVSSFAFNSSTQKRFQQGIDEVAVKIANFRQVIDDTRSEWEREGPLTPAQLLAIDQMNRDLQDMIGNYDKFQALFARMKSDAADEYFEDIERAVLGMNSQISKFVSRNAADNLQDRLARVADEGKKLANNIDDLIRNTEALANTDSRYLPLLELLYNARERMNRAGEEALQIETALYNIELDKLRLQTEQVQLQNQQAKLRLDRQYNQSAFLQGLGAFDSTSIAEDQRLSLQLEINSLNKQILDLNEQIKDTTDQAVKAELVSQRESIKQLISITEDALASVSAYAVASRQLWTDVGRSVQDLTKGALKGLIDGTLNAKDLLLRFWNQVTDAAIDYIFQLIFIKGLMSSIFSGLGNPFGFLGGFAGGGAFMGNVKPFANGDIIKGPTLFGLAGEAGTEAIMPLTRGADGKLGVQAVGGGGDTFHITIQAIDTQTGAQFLAKNADVIVQQLHRANRMNKGVGSMI